jgi:hypothetical protein
MGLGENIGLRKSEPAPAKPSVRKGDYTTKLRERRFSYLTGKGPYSPKSLVSRRITRHWSVRLNSANCHLRENCASRSISRVTIANKMLTEIPHIRTPMTLSRGANGRQLDGRLTSLQPRVE